MFDLFRFMVLRPPEKFDPSLTISIDGNTPFVVALRTAASSSDAGGMKKAAEDYVKSPNFVGNPSSLSYSKQYVAVSAGLTQKSNVSEVEKLISKNFPKRTAAAVAADKNFSNDKLRVQDSLTALQLASPPATTSQETLTLCCRVIDLIERVGRNDPTLNSQGAILQAMNRIIVLPPGLFPVPSAPVAQKPATKEDGSAAATQARLGLLKRATALREALQAVKTLPFESSRLASEQAAPGPTAVAAPQAKAPSPPVASASLVKRRPALLTASNLPEPGVDLSALQALPSSVRSVLADLHLDLSTTSVLAAANQLSTKLLETEALLTGGTIGIVGTPPPDPFHDPPTPGESADDPPGVLVAPPSSFGYVAPVGVADLLVVREHVLRYEPAEIACVENIAKGEVFKRDTKRKDTTESSTLTTNTWSQGSQRDLQTTDRFDLQRQAQIVVQQNTNRIPGVGSSDAYGPLVDSGGSTTQSASQGSNYGQDVTSRAVSMLTESLQTQVLQLSASEFEERTEHNYDNTKGTPDQIVVYQWLDKISEVQVFSYDKRVIYDFIVPEPAAFLVHELEKWQPELQQLQKPTLFSLQPHDLSVNANDKNFYQYWASGYGTTGVQPPPEPTITLVREYGDKAPDPFAGDSSKQCVVGIDKADDGVAIPPGYRADSAAITATSVQWLGFGMLLRIAVGEQIVDFTQDGTQLVKLPNREVQNIALSVLVEGTEENGAGGPEEFTVAIAINCVLTEQGLAQWQLQTHDTILQASRDRLAEYEDRLNTLTAALRVKAASKTSEQKLALVEAELEKACISILSNQHFDVLNAIEFSDLQSGFDVYPQLFLPNVGPVGQYIRFFEQAFEWDQMMYRYYPYFWGRKKYWNDRLQLDDQDSEFAAFLAAGAARVTVPVRKGYELALDKFLKTGNIPSEADLVDVTTDLYVPFFAEMLGASGGRDVAVAYGPPWEVRVPSKLVKIRTDGTLPKWQRKVDNAGHVTYIPVAGDSVNP